MDPACAWPHAHWRPFDLLYAIYEKEGYAPNEDPRPNPCGTTLYGIEIDVMLVRLRRSLPICEKLGSVSGPS